MKKKQENNTTPRLLSVLYSKEALTLKPLDGERIVLSTVDVSGLPKSKIAKITMSSDLVASFVSDILNSDRLDAKYSLLEIKEDGIIFSLTLFQPIPYRFFGKNKDKMVNFLLIYAPLPELDVVTKKQIFFTGKVLSAELDKKLASPIETLRLRIDRALPIDNALSLVEPPFLFDERVDFTLKGDEIQERTKIELSSYSKDLFSEDGAWEEWVNKEFLSEMMFSVEKVGAVLERILSTSPYVKKYKFKDKGKVLSVSFSQKIPFVLFSDDSTQLVSDVKKLELTLDINPWYQAIEEDNRLHLSGFSIEGAVSKINGFDVSFIQESDYLDVLTNKE
jgi:hypothetical protein